METLIFFCGVLVGIYATSFFAINKRTRASSAPPPISEIHLN